MSAAVTLVLLFFCSVALKEQVTEGCRCVQRHPQRHFCSSDVVLRAKVIGKAFSNHLGLTAYKIQTIEKFKPLNKNRITHIFTSQTACGINLESGEYLLSGHVEDGVVVVGLCDRVERWDSLSFSHKAYLSMYKQGCVCEIFPCTGASCLIKMHQRICLVDFDDQMVLQSICLPGSDTSCRWHNILDK